MKKAGQIGKIVVGIVILAVIVLAIILVPTEEEEVFLDAPTTVESCSTDECFFDAARSTRDVSVCNTIQSASLKAECLSEPWLITGCQTELEEGDANDCLLRLAVTEEKSIAACNVLTDFNKFVQCRKDVIRNGILSQDASVCFGDTGCVTQISQAVPNVCNTLSEAGFPGEQETACDVAQLSRDAAVERVRSEFPGFSDSDYNYLLASNYLKTDLCNDASAPEGMLDDVDVSASDYCYTINAFKLKDTSICSNVQDPNWNTLCTAPFTTTNCNSLSASGHTTVCSIKTTFVPVQGQGCSTLSTSLQQLCTALRS